MAHKSTKIKAGEYRCGEYLVIREDYPSQDEWGYEEYDRTWYVLPIAIADWGALPDAVYEADTKRDCIAWINSREAS